MDRANFALISFVSLILFASPAYACDPPTIYIVGVFVLPVIPYVLLAALALACLRNRWLDGSWNHWFKETLFSTVLAGLGLGLGVLLVQVLPVHDLPWIEKDFSFWAFASVVGTTPLLFLVGQFVWLKIKAERPQMSLMTRKDLVLIYLASPALLPITAYAFDQTISESVVIAAVIYGLASTGALACLRTSWLDSSWIRWMKQSVISFALVGLGFGVGYLLMGIELAINKGIYPYFSATALFITPLAFLASQFVWLKRQG